MNRGANAAVALCIAALAFFSFFVFPGHTYLTQDTQIYVPVLEHLWDPTALTNDFLVVRSHIAFTLYDEYAIALRWLTRSNFAVVLQSTQIICRGLGIWGVYLIGLAILHHRLSSLAVAAACAMGAEVWGPAVLVVEFEPSPRAFAIPLLLLAIGLCAHHRFAWAAAVATLGFVFHPTSVAPFWLCFALLRQWRLGVISLLCGSLLLAVSAYFEPGISEHQYFFSRIPPDVEPILRIRAAYNWIGMWFHSEWPKYLACTAVGAAAYWRLRSGIPNVLHPFLLCLPFLGLLSAPVSYLLLDRAKWAVIPQVQPARLLLWTVAIPVLLAATAAFRTKRTWETPLWLALALTPALAAPRPRIIPTPAFTELSHWAAVNTPKDTVFLFPESGKSLEPGLFRSQALRAVYVDWKGGGQANFIPGFSQEWWRRYQDVIGHSQPLEHYRSLGIDYLIYPGQPYRIVKVPKQ